MNRKRLPGIIAAVLFSSLLFAAEGFSADWPTWRCDALRSAATDEELPDQLHLQWTRRLPPLEPAWPDEHRMRFDVAYEPIVMGKTMFVASPRNDSVTAMDTETGAEKWRFFADGPVRFAPVAWRDKLYFGSDDGYLYCLSAAEGDLLWRFRGGPADRKVLGNKRLISTWPVRGAPVIAAGKVYFAAGIWPFMGTFIYALDAETGKPVWINDGTSADYILQPHNSPAFAGVAPQGYLVAAGDRLLIPGGRSVPACFDRNTGKLLYFHLAVNKYTGSYHASATAGHFFNSGHLWDLETGKLSGTTGPNPVLSSEAAYHVIKDAITASDIQNVSVEEVTDSKGRKSKRLTIPTVWRLSAKADAVWLRAGSRLFASHGSSVFAVDIPSPDAEPKLSWQTEIEGTPSAMLAADGKLFVVTLEGAICCFGAQETEPTILPAEAPQAPPMQDKWTQEAADILKRTGVTEGYCLVLGAQDGRLAEELARQSSLHVIAIGPDPERIDAVRRRLDAAGLYGARVAACVGDALSANLPPYMASLIVAEDLEAAGYQAGEGFVEAVFHALRPYGGVACLRTPLREHYRLAKWRRSGDLPSAAVRRRGSYALLTRVGPLPGSADWTHQYGDAANTCASKDKLVKAPLGLLWFGGSSNVTILPRHGHGPAEQVASGRLFIEGPDTLRAMDVYTGRVLWEIKLPGIGDAYNYTSHEPGANAVGTNFVAAHDAVYVAYGKRCLRLDAATGKTLSEFTLPAAPDAEGTPAWGYIGLLEDLLIAGASPVIFEGTEKIGKRNNWDATSSKRIVVMDRRSGEVKWSFDSVYCFRHNAIAVGGGKLFCIDRLPDTEVQRMERRGETLTAEPKLTALDVRTGKVIWSTTEDVFGTWLGYSEEHDLLLQAGRPSRDMLPNEPGDRMIAYRGADGAVLWNQPHKYYGPPVLKGDTIITQAISMRAPGKAFDLLTGEQRMRTSSVTGEEAPWEYARNYGCNTVIASEHLITFRSAAAGYYDLCTDGGTGNLGGFKSGCTSNLVVANGVLNAPEYTRTCTCSYQNQTSLALIHAPEVEQWTFNTFKLGEEPVRRLGVNLGAPGDRVAENGTLWLEYPTVGGPSPAVAVKVAPESPHWFRRHSSRIEGEGPKWVAASGAVGLESLTIKLAANGDEERTYTVALYFTEPEGLKPGARVFDVMLQGETALKGLDIAAEAGGGNRVLVKRFSGVKAREDLMVAFRPAAASAAAVLCGVEVVAEGW